MFTGLVQKVGTLAELVRKGEGWSLRIDCEAWKPPLELGESVAVQGACLTVTSADAQGFTADLLDETRRRSALATLAAGAPLNLERALSVGARLGGHFVTGHVDEVGTIRHIRSVGRDFEWTIGCSPRVARGTVEKGSIAVDGVSLTVIAVTDDSVSVALIPHTLEHTSLRARREGEGVNLESDILGKYVARCWGEGSTKITPEFLRANGFKL